MAAATISLRTEGVTSYGQRRVDYYVEFANGTAVTVAKATLGLATVNEVWVKSLSSGATGVDWSQDSTNLTLDSLAAGNVTIRIVGSEL